MRALNWKKHLIALVASLAIFGTAFLLSDFLNSRRMEEMRSIQDSIAIDLLASEVQFTLLADSSCDDAGEALSKELNTLAERLQYMEETLGADNAEVAKLKKYYTLLEIKDYLLMKRVGKKCKQEPIFVLYFYSNQGDCPDCKKMGHVLTYLRETYPNLRVYAFDYNMDVSAIGALRSTLKVKDELPAIIIEDKPYYGFKPTEDIEKLLPALVATSTATTSTTTARK
jgi:thiol-disulfide isomerase/thioredoxin